MLEIFKRKIPLYTLIFSCLLVFATAYVLFNRVKSESQLMSAGALINDCPGMMDQIRLKKYEFIQPLILANVSTESSSLNGIRSKVQQFIDQKKASRQAEDITVYFRKLNNGEWFCINPNQLYNPASMSKIIYIITYLKEAEFNPGIFNKKIYFAHHFSQVSQQNIKTFSLQENTNYKVSDLMNFMIKYSDNDATVLLSQNMNKDIYHQLFKDLDIPTPNEVGEYTISAFEYSKFFRVLYNASYIRPEYSEYALKLLTLSEFSDGLRKGVDSTVAISHKFGERIMGDSNQMHEFGIVYVKNNPYLIGVCTKGSSLTELSSIIAEISRIVYTDYINMFPN